MKSFDIKTKIFFGDQALDRLSEIPYQKVLVVTDPFIAQGEMIELVTEPLRRGNKEFEIFKDVVPDPPIEKISEGVRKMLEYRPDAIVAVGGGSAIDSSKSIREFALRVDHYTDVGLIAIPTTSGTGSEVTSFAVVTDPAEQVKYPLVSKEMMPDEAILDAELVKSVPPSVTAGIREWMYSHTLWRPVSVQTEMISRLPLQKRRSRYAEYSS